MRNKWDVRFIGLARHIAQWSKDPSTKCGAVITDGKFVVSVGFNGFARFTDDSPEKYMDRDYKYENVIHAEENAILSAEKDLTDHFIYLTGAGCSRCTARVIQVGISRVIIPCKKEDAFAYRSDWNQSFERARAQLSSADVGLTVLGPTGFNVADLMGPEHPHSKELYTLKQGRIKT
jgi:dCMP deaminase